LGYAFSSRPGQPPEGPPSADPTEFIAFRQTADGGYEIELPGYEPGRLILQGHNGSYDASGWTSVYSSFHQVTRGSSADVQDVGVTLRRPAGPLNPSITLSYTSFGEWEATTRDEPQTVRYGYFAYGIPTATRDVPVTGTATYKAEVIGQTSIITSGSTAQWPDYMGGKAQLRFDFGAGTLAGHMDAILGSCFWSCVELPRYAFRDTVYARGATGFSGSFEVPATGPAGFFEGQFTGPGAAELAARFQAPFKHPDFGTGQMYGIWVGKRD
jgi:hypothetical protein